MEQSFFLSLHGSFSCVGVLEFFKTELDSYVALLFHPLDAESQGHHHKFMVVSNVGSWKVTGLAMLTFDWKRHLNIV